MLVNGSNFESGASLSFLSPGGETTPGDPTKLIFVNATLLSYKFSPTSAGLWKATVTNQDESFSNSFSFTVNATTATATAPSISSVSPSSFPPSAADQKMTIHGNHFQSGSTLTFLPAHGSAIGGKANKLAFVDSTQLTYQFNDDSDAGNWSVTVTNPDSQSSNTEVFTVTAAVQQQDTLTVSGSGGGNGTVTSNPGGINCTITAGSASGTCSASYPAGTSVALTEDAANGYGFSSWTGACTGTSSCSVSMTQPQKVSANFTAAQQAQNTLTVSGNGAGNGVVTSNAGGINCTMAAGNGTGTCTANYMSGASVTLTASPASGYSFNGWSGACTGTTPCTLYMTQAQSVSANFIVIPASYLISVSTYAPTGISTAGGTVSGAGSYSPGANVALIASPASGYNFVNWTEGGTVVSTNASYSFSAVANRTLVANFVQQNNLLAITANGTGNGTITSNSAGINGTTINCVQASGTTTGTCQVGYAPNATVMLTATPASGYSFSGWAGACSGTGACSLSMATPNTVTANFTAVSSGPQELVKNGSFSKGDSSWNLAADFWAGTNLTNYRTAPGYASGGVDNTGLAKNNAIGSMYQDVTIPATASSATLSFWYNVTSSETGTAAYDSLTLSIASTTGGGTLAVVSKNIKPQQNHFQHELYASDL